MNFIQFKIMFFHFRKYPFNFFGTKIPFFYKRIIINLNCSLFFFIFNVLTEKIDDPVWVFLENSLFHENLKAKIQ